jgi:hypothetical protein
MDGISTAVTVLSALIKMHTIPCHDRGHINIMLVLQSCRDSLQVLPGSSTDTWPALSDDTFDVNNVYLEEEEAVNVTAEKDVGC